MEPPAFAAAGAEVDMFGLPALDLIVIAVYFSVVIAIGVWASRRIKGTEDYFLAGRRFGKLVQTFATFGQATAADDAVSVSTTAFKNGASGIWSALLYLFATPTYWLISPWYRRLRLLTLGDYFKERFGSARMAATYAIIGTVGMMVVIALGFNAMSKTVAATIPKPATEFSDAERAAYAQAVAEQEALLGQPAEALGLLTLGQLEERDRLAAVLEDERTPAQDRRLSLLDARKQAVVVSYIDGDTLVWLICLIVILYAALGGLEAAFLTDTIQGVFIIVLSVLLLPFAWSRLNEIYGGSGVSDAMGHVHRLLPDSFFELFGSPNTVDFTWYYIIAISAMTILNVAIQPNQLVAAGAGRDEFATRFGFTVGSFVKRFCTVFWGVFGLTAVALYGDRIHDSDLVWGVATRDLLGPLGIGLVGLMLACLMAALMSTVDCLMLTCASLLTHNVYRLAVPDRDQLHYVWIGRMLGALVVLCSAWIALQFDTIFQILKFIWEMNVALAPAFWLGMKWRRANRLGAWASIGIGATLFLVLPMLLPAVAPSLRTNQRLLETTHPAPIARVYTASEYDVKLRQAEIAEWEALPEAQRFGARPPRPLELGEAFEKVYPIPPRSIYWTQGIRADADGQLTGRGTLSLELVAVDSLGFDLSQNAYAQNETLRIIIRVVVPFLLLIVISLATRPDPVERLDRFYAKMRTPVIADRARDDREVTEAQDDPDRSRHRLLFPGSSWELYRWSLQDLAGFFVSCVAVVCVLLFAMVLVSIGG